MARNILRAAITKTSQVKLPRKPVIYLPVLLGLAILLGGSAFALLPPLRKAQSAAPASTRADLFMHSVVIEDGALGWHQLCPALQAQLPLEALQSQAAEQKASNARQNITFAMKYVGSQAQS